MIKISLLLFYLLQVISIDVRSKLQEDYSLDTDTTNEIPYCKILNRLLPDEIRAVAWRPAPSDFSSRFDCVQRTYKYYFPRGNLNLEVSILVWNYRLN